MNKKFLLLFLIILIFLSSFSFVSAQQTKAETEKDICAIYFTGVGCPHCARADPAVLIDSLDKYENFIVIEYEIYQQTENAHFLIDYNEKYNTGLGVPLIIFEHSYKIGDKPIIDNLNSMIEKGPSNCLLLNAAINFNNININNIPGKPKIWTKDKILIKESGGGDSNILRQLLIASNISKVVKGSVYSIIKSKKVALSGTSVEFDNAIEIDGWVFQWNGPSIGYECSCPKPGEWSKCIDNEKNRTNYKCSTETNFTCVSYIEIVECGDEIQKLTFTKLISLAAVDAVNPCALAVLTLMLIAILTYNPKNKKNILLAGLAFTCSVFIMYLFYGLIIIKFFQLVQVLTSVRIWLYKILGTGAIILGFLNIKDFIRYKPGSFGTEMPLGMRPKLKKIMSRITSPKGAFSIGIFVTLFLLPCTIGPYVIAGGILSAFELIKTIPPLLLYNLIFVLPMLIITILVFAGFARIEDVSGWKDRNIRRLHLVAGLIMVALGLAMILGLV